MRWNMLHCLALTALVLPLAACERPVDGDEPSADGTPAVEAPAAVATPEATPPAEPASTPAPDPSGAAETPAAPEPEAPVASSPADVPRMPVAEAAERAQRGEVVLVDVRDYQSWQIEHIEGAVSLPLSQVAERAGELPRDKVIVTYCA